MSVPPMGPECIPDQTCTRSLDPGSWTDNCGKPASHHIIWRDPTAPPIADDGWGFGCPDVRIASAGIASAGDDVSVLLVGDAK